MHIEDCSPGRPFFRFIDTYWKGKSRYTIHRLCTLMRKMGARSIAVEEMIPTLKEWEPFNTELRSIEKRLGWRPASDVRKLTFLLPEKGTVEKGFEHLNDDDFLAYARIVNLDMTERGFHSYIFESTIRELSKRIGLGKEPEKWHPLLNNYLHIKKEFRCNVGATEKNPDGRPYKLVGSFFCQQNQITSVCAHACAAMMLSNCSEVTSLISCEDINRCIGIDQESRMLHTHWAESNAFATHAGLTSTEVAAVFRRFGFAAYQMPFWGQARRLFREFIYGFVESGYPALLAFTTKGDPDPVPHVVPFFGHTLNSDSWFPTAFFAYAHPAYQEDKPYLSSLDWVGDFLVHDDNFGMYYCLPAHSFRPEDHPDPKMDFSPTEGIGIYPKKKGVVLPSFLAERLAHREIRRVYGYLLQKEPDIVTNNYYSQHLILRFNPNDQRWPIVLRTTLVTREQYLRHLAEGKDYENTEFRDDEKSVIAKELDNHEDFWLVEVSEPDLYVGNKSKVIDLVLDPTLDPSTVIGVLDNTSIDNPLVRPLLIRFPGSLIIPQDSGYQERIPLGVKSHYPLFTFDKDRHPFTIW